MKRRRRAGREGESSIGPKSPTPQNHPVEVRKMQKTGRQKESTD